MGTLALTGIHSLFLLGLMVGSSHVLIRGLREEDATKRHAVGGALVADSSWWTWSALGWAAAAVVWLVVYLFGFLML